MDADLLFPRLVRAHTADVWTTALRLTGSHADAEDLVQEVFASAWAALESWPPERVAALRPRAWLVTITLNAWRNGLRSASRRPSTIPLLDHDAAVQPADHLDETERLGQLVARLPEAYRAPVVLRHVVGLTYAEIATALDCPPGTVKAQVSRGLALLRKELSWT
ncbi:MAG: sigma-70 family RNA polymerase sigma factor [Frankiaceae bacterium]|nr:sigma-70 family RNA polymerase sigma factor [Frankiaceae bacterium]